MLKSISFHIWSSKMDQMYVFVCAFVQCLTGKCTENKLSNVCFSAGLFKCQPASSRAIERIPASDFCQCSVHVHLSWISSAEQEPQANIPVNFFNPDSFHLLHFSPNYKPPQLRSSLPCTEGWSVRRMWVWARAHLASLSDWGEGDMEGGLLLV